MNRGDLPRGHFQGWGWKVGVCFGPRLRCAVRGSPAPIFSSSDDMRVSRSRWIMRADLGNWNSTKPALDSRLILVGCTLHLLHATKGRVETLVENAGRLAKTLLQLGFFLGHRSLYGTTNVIMLLVIELLYSCHAISSSVHRIHVSKSGVVPYITIDQSQHFATTPKVCRCF